MRKVKERRVRRSKCMANSNESYDIKDLEDDFKGHYLKKKVNYSSVLEATMDLTWRLWTRL